MPDQAQKRKKLYSLLGDLPPRNRKLTVEKIGEEDRGKYILERLYLDLNGLEKVPAYFVKPKNPGGKMPLVIYNHAHGGDYALGKDELLLGRPAVQKPPYAEVLAENGYAGFCMDTWNFGERKGRTESELFKEMLWKGRVLWGMMVYDSLRAVDYLSARGDIDAGRIATLGISMGSTMAWWLAALDTRIKVCVDICCLTDFEAILETQNLDQHGIYYYVPGLLKHFDTSKINGLIAPRAHLALAGNYDRLTPVKGLIKIDKNLKKIYAKMKKPGNWQLVRYETGHFENADMRARIFEYLRRHL